MELLTIKGNTLEIKGNIVSLEGKPCLHPIYQDEICIIYYRAYCQLEIERKLGSGVPLYYASSSSKFVLCTNIRDLNTFRSSVNMFAVNELINNGYVFPPNTLWGDVYKVPLCCKLKISFFHQIQATIVFTQQENAEFLNSTFEISMPEVTYASLLFSGGLDSLILAKLYRNNINEYISTGFEFSKEDLIERNYALTAARAMNIRTKYKSYQLNELLELLPEIIYATGEPVNHIQTLLLYKLIKDFSHSNNILNGQGADAFFGTGSQYQYYHQETIVFHSNRDFPFQDYVIQSFPISTLRNAVGILENSMLSDLDKNFYYEIMGDCDATMNCWTTCAKVLGKTMIYPYFNDNNYKNIMKIDWGERLREKKHLLRNIARQYGIAEELVIRKKGSFGPVSCGWGNGLLPLLSLGKKYFKFSKIVEDLNISCNRYMIWNMINFSIWALLFIEKINVAELGCEINNLIKEAL